MITLCTTNFFKSVEEAEFESYHKSIDIKSIDDKIREWIRRDEIGFFRLSETQKTVLSEIKSYLKKLPDEIDTFVLVGIGGSSLGPITIHEALKHIYPSPKKFICLENVDPVYNQSLIEGIDPKRCLVNVVSKSGGTAETAVNFLWIYESFKTTLKEDCSKHFVFTTDPQDGLLNQIAEKEKIHRFFIPKNVGGRFSVLTAVALLMSEFMAYNAEEMLRGAEDFYQNLNSNFDENPALQYALIHHFLFSKKGINISVLMPYSSLLKELTNWYKQLWAESLGKEKTLDGSDINCGQSPVSSVGAVDQHSLVQLFMEGPFDKIVNFIKVKKFKSDIRVKNSFPYISDFDLFTEHRMSDLLNFELEGTAFALSQKKRANLTIEIDEVNSYYMGQLFYFFEVATAISGILYGINAFDQPGVESGKMATKALLGDDRFSELKSQIINN